MGIMISIITILVLGFAMGMIRAVDGQDLIPRWATVVLGAFVLTALVTPVWWMFPLQAFGVAAIFWGGWSSMLDWAQGLPLSDPEEHKPAYYAWKYMGKDIVWPVTRYGFNLIPLLILNVGWYALAWPVFGLGMVMCYKASYIIKTDGWWARRAEFASWALLGVLIGILA
jgi:hypothetical protein